MNLSESFALAIKNIWSSKMRSFLTMLGIIIGVAAVIIIVGLGNGMQNYVTGEFASLGTNTITVSIRGRGASTTRSVSVEDMYDLAHKNSDYFCKISPTVSMSGKIKIGNETISTTTAAGISEDYLTIKDYPVESGRGIQYIDVYQRKQVCVIGSYLEDTYFNGNALGQTIKIGGNTVTIVGVLKQIDDKPDKSGSDDVIFMPYSTAARMSYTGTISNFTLMLVDENQADAAVEIINKALYDIFDDEDYYSVFSMSAMLDTMTSMINVMITILTVIAGISLVVGGIGIMNIMLVSVTERTREIGIRKALGAKERYIMQQFVIEAATTSAIGGVIGIAIGYLISSVATVVVSAVLQTDLAVTPSIGSVIVAFGISAGIGILFGYLPAKKAARLNPIDALHYD